MKEVKPEKFYTESELPKLSRLRNHVKIKTKEKQMKSYISCEIVKAIKMTDLEFEREQIVFQSAKKTVALYQEGETLLRYGGELCGEVPRIPRDPKDGYKVMYCNGYIHWSPKITFETACRELTEQERAIVIS